MATSQTLAAAARLDASARAQTRRALHRTGLPTQADVRRLAAQIAALDRAVDALH